jgi:hypothetical protein
MAPHHQHALAGIIEHHHDRGLREPKHVLLEPNAVGQLDLSDAQA